MATAVWFLFVLWFTPLLSFCFSQIQEPLPRPDACQHGNDVIRKVSEQEVADLFFRPHGTWQRPRLNSSATVSAAITFVISSINEVEESEGRLTLLGYMQVEWMDELRVWADKFPYNCVDYLVVPSDQLWIPDVSIMNAQGKYELMMKEGEKVRAYSNGYMHYSPGGSIVSNCEYDMTMFPMDTQNCFLQIESWRYPRQSLSFQLSENVTLKNWVDHEEWELIGIEQQLIDKGYLDPSLTFDHITVCFKLKRKSLHFVLNIIIPGSLMALAYLTSFTQPVGAVKRFETSFECLVTLCALLMIAAENLPRSSTHLPLLIVYFDLLIGYVCVSMVWEGLANLALSKCEETKSNGSPGGPVPKWLFRIVTSIACLVQIGPFVTPNQKFNGTLNHDVYKMRGTSNKIFTKNKKGKRSKLATRASAKLQWYYVSCVIDRFVAILYALAIIITPIVLFLILPALHVD